MEVIWSSLFIVVHNDFEILNSYIRKQKICSILLYNHKNQYKHRKNHAHKKQRNNTFSSCSYSQSHNNGRQQAVKEQ